MISMQRLLTICALLSGCWVLSGQPPLADMEPVLAKIAKFEHGQSREALGQFTEFLSDSMGSQAQLRQIEARLIRLLQSGPTAAGRDFVLSQLTFIATDASIPVLLTLQARAETAEAARMQLERIPGPAASEALRKSLARATGNTRVGIVNSLGRRRDTASVPALAALISPSDRGTTGAVLAALAGIADPPAVKALAAARTKLQGLLKEEASEAYAECADQLAKRGDTAGALRVYRELIKPQESAVVRIRALSGLVALEGKSALPALTAALHSRDRTEQGAAVMFLRRIPGEECTKALVTEFPKLPAPGQVRVLAALADRGDVSGKPLVLAALTNNSGDVRAAGLEALGKLGDESSVMVLAEAAAEHPGPEQAAARQSLWGLRGANINRVIVDGIGSKSGKVRAELIAAAGERGISAAADALAKAVGSGDPEVQRAAVRALRNVGGSGQVAVLLDLTLKASAASGRKEATQTLSALLKKSQPELIGSVLSAYERTSSVESRLSLLEVMGQSSNEAALPLLRKSLSDPNAEIARGAILAMTAWEKPATHTDLFAVAENSKDPLLKTLALRGCIKQIGLPSDRSVSETARLLSQAMRLAMEPAEKKSILSLAVSHPCPEALQLAESSLGDAAVASEAKAAVARLRAALRR